MTVLDRKAILGADDLKIEEVKVPEWGGSVFVRTLTGDERDKYESSLIQISGEGVKRTITQKWDNVRATLAFLSICDKNGERIFTDPADIVELGRKSAGALDRVFEVARRLSGLSEEDIEELVGDLEPTQT